MYDASMIRMLAFDFPKDAKALEITDQYLFGESLMVCPVTETMYYKKSALASFGKSKANIRIKIGRAHV